MQWACQLMKIRKSWVRVYFSFGRWEVALKISIGKFMEGKTSYFLTPSQQMKKLRVSMLLHLLDSSDCRPTPRLLFSMFSNERLHLPLMSHPNLAIDRRYHHSATNSRPSSSHARGLRQSFGQDPHLFSFA